MSRLIKISALACAVSAMAISTASAQDAELDPRFQPRVYGNLNTIPAQTTPQPIQQQTVQQQTVQLEQPTIVRDSAPIIYRSAIPASSEVEYSGDIVRAEHYTLANSSTETRQKVATGQPISEEEKVRIYQAEINGYDYAAPQIAEPQPQQNIAIELYADPVVQDAGTFTTYGTTYDAPAAPQTYTAYTSQTAVTSLMVTVAPSQGIYRIAKNNCSTQDAIREANGLIKGQENLKPGQQLIIPGGGCNAQPTTSFHTASETQTVTTAVPTYEGSTTLVRNIQPIPGIETNRYAVLPKQGLQAIGRETCRDWRQIASINGLTSTNNYALSVGQMLTLPTETVPGCIPQ